MSKSSKPTPIAIPNELKATIDQVAERLGWSTQQTMREAMKLGLAFYDHIDYNVTDAVLNAALTKSNIVNFPQDTAQRTASKDGTPSHKKAYPAPTPNEESRVAEDPVNYGSDGKATITFEEDISLPQLPKRKRTKDKPKGN